MSVAVSVIVPYFNEPNIINTYQVLTSYLKEKFSDYELIFVDDGSDIYESNPLGSVLADDVRVKQIVFPKNFGRGKAVIEGFHNAKGNALAYIDGDLEIDHNQLKTMVKSLHIYDAVIGCKHIAGSQMSAPKFRVVASLLFNGIVRLLLGSALHDHQTGLKVFRRDVVLSVLDKMKEKRWLFDIELLYVMQIRHHNILEVPVKVAYATKLPRLSFITEFVLLPWKLLSIKQHHSYEK